MIAYINVKILIIEYLGVVIQKSQLNREGGGMHISEISEFLCLCHRIASQNTSLEGHGQAETHEHHPLIVFE